MPPDLLRRVQLWRCPSKNEWHKTDNVPKLSGDGADVWLCPLSPEAHESAGPTADTMSSLLTADVQLSSLLSDDETERAQNFFPESKAIEFKLARGWLRLLLAAYVAEAEPRLIRLGITESGKPYLIDYPALNFNLSHSGGYVAIAVSSDHVGIDIEKLRPLPDWRELAEGLLTNIAIEQIASLPEIGRSEAFLRQFTAREAYLKATGGGFSQSTTIVAHEFHTIAMENHSYAPTVPLPEIPGYVGQICLLRGVHGISNWLISTPH